MWIKKRKRQRLIYHFNRFDTNKQPPYTFSIGNERVLYMNLDEHWYVLLTIRSKEQEVCKYLNENEGIFAFSPKMEFYHRVSKQIQQRTLFGGYVFVVSKLSQVEVDRIFRKFPLESVFIHELKYKEDISALTDEEIRILTMLMDDKKILRMSYGILLNNKIHVTRGPLVNMDDYIIKYDKHNRLATLNLNFLNQIWKVGVTLIEQCDKMDVLRTCPFFMYLQTCLM